MILTKKAPPRTAMQNAPILLIPLCLLIHIKTMVGILYESCINHDKNEFMFNDVS